MRTVGDRSEPQVQRLKRRQRWFWAIADQGLYSASNFLLTLSVLRSTSVEEFGIYSIAYASFLLLLGSWRGMTGDVFLVKFRTDGDHQSWPKAVAGAGLLGGIMASAILLLPGLFLQGTGQTFFFIFAVACPFVLLQDSLRYVLLAAARAREMALIDGLWLVTQVAVLGAVGLAPNLQVAMGSWLVGAAVSVLAACLILRLGPSIGSGFRWVLANRFEGLSFSGEFLADRGITQLGLMGVGALGGLATLGTVQAARLLFSPLNVLFMGSVAVASSEGAKVAREDPRALQGYVLRLGLVLGVGALGYLALVLLIPTEIGMRVFGETWQRARPILPWIGLSVASAGFQHGPRAGLRMLVAARDSLRTRSRVSVTRAVGLLGGCRVHPPQGVAVGLLLANVVGIGVYWFGFLGALRERHPHLQHSSGADDDN